MVRVRFAPSPTGYLHVGGARTALFNWLYARRHGGVFVLRIEDTDAERSSWDMVEGIIEGLRWLGLDWDEGPDVGGPCGPYFQSQRLERYRAFADQLLAGGQAYYCYCTTDRLQAERDKAREAGGGWMYDRRCLGLTPEERAALEAAGAPRAVRVLVPPGETRFDDRVHGATAFPNASVEDFVILRSDGQPTYQLSVVVDDIDMRITHVVRGDDHISNTPKQIVLYRAAGAEPPVFAHVPLIMGPDKQRLSKRHGATSVMEYCRAGYLPEAMVNFLALLGWSPGAGNEEVFTKAELVERFTLEGISGSSAVFNQEKLDWFNGQHLARLPGEELVARLRPELEPAGLWRASLAGDEREWFLRVLDLLKPRARKLADFVPQLIPFLGEVTSYDQAAVAKHLTPPGLADHVRALAAALGGTDPFDAAATEATLRRVAEKRGLKAGTLIHAARIAVTGQGVSPGLFDVLALVGRDHTIARLTALAAWLP